MAILHWQRRKPNNWTCTSCKKYNDLRHGKDRPNGDDVCVGCGIPKAPKLSVRRGSEVADEAAAGADAEDGASGDLDHDKRKEEEEYEAALADARGRRIASLRAAAAGRGDCRRRAAAAGRGDCRRRAAASGPRAQGRARREGPGSQRLQRLQGLAGQGLAGQGRALVV